MNLEDVIDPEYGLQQDEFSLGRPRFGEQGQLEVIGWSGKRGSIKYYLLKCSVCSKDGELHGDGVFRSEKGNLTSRKVPCGCSRNPRWSETQWLILAQRKAEQLGHVAVGFAEPFKGAYTKLIQQCDRHVGGLFTWSSGSLDGLINSGIGCPECGVEVVRQSRLKPDEVMIASFEATGQFVEGTRFWRSDRLCSEGKAIYWHVYCPDCSYTGESSNSNLQRGCRPCLCSPSRQQQAYINWIISERNQAAAIKFGIANIASARVQQQNRSSTYEVRNHSIWEFPSKKHCRDAENECKRELECGVLSKEDMPDGWTETTHVYNLGRIKDTYAKHGGVIMEEL